MKTLPSLAGSFLVIILTLTFMCLTQEDPMAIKCRQMHQQVEGMKPQTDSERLDRCVQLLTQAEICRQRARSIRAEANRLANEAYRAPEIAAEVDRLYNLSHTERLLADSLLRQTQEIMAEMRRAEPVKP